MRHEFTDHEWAAIAGRQAAAWSRIMNALATAHDAAVQMIDTFIVRVHQHAALASLATRDSPWAGRTAV